MEELKAKHKRILFAGVPGCSKAPAVVYLSGVFGLPIFKK